MRRLAAGWLVLCFAAWAPSMATAQNAAGGIRAPRGFKQYVVNGKLRVSVGDAVRLMLLNNSGVRIEQQSVKQARDAVMRAKAPFDPLLTSSFSANRQTTPTFSQLTSGTSTLGSLTQDTQAGVQKTFSTGTQFSSAFDTSRNSTNSVYNFFNPSLFSELSFSLSQPLLRNRGIFVNRAPIVIAQRNLSQSEAQFRQQINDAIQTVIRQYWQVVLDRESLQVLAQSLEAAQASYDHDQRALQLGALSPLDIYQSESEVATRKVAVIQAQYALKQDEDQLRMTLGADLDPADQALDLVLIEPPEPARPLRSVDTSAAIRNALSKRPDLAALERQLESNEIDIRASRNRLKPDLELSAQYSSSGLGGNEYSSTGARTLIAGGGLGDALGQVFGFGFPSYGVTLKLNLPIRNRAAEANLADARVRRDETLYEIRRSREQVRLDVENAVNQLNQAKLSMAAAQTARDLAEKNVEAQQRKYELGSVVIFFVLQAQTQLAQAEQSLVQAQVNYQLAAIDVQHATGALLGRYQVQITQAAP
jgi:outer membrane protein